MRLSTVSQGNTLEPGPERSLPQWLARAGFEWHPFEQADAAQEENLAEYFIAPPKFWAVTGRRHTVLYAPLGGGKTATRVMVEHLCASGEIQDTLVVTCDDFERVLQQVEGRPEEVTAQMLIKEVMRRVADVIFEHWIERIESFQKTSNSHRRWVAQFLSNWEDRLDEALSRIGLAEKISAQTLQERPLEEFRDQVNEEYWPWVEMLASLALLRKGTPEERMAGECLERLADAARQLGFRMVYILFDRVDGLKPTASPEGCAALVQPLLDATALLSVPNVYFKFFLPVETRPLLSRTAGVRSRRITEVVMEWDSNTLLELLRLRLLAASERTMESLAAISEAKDIDTQLVRYAQTSRHLLLLGRRVFEEHERRSPESLQLMKQDLTTILEAERTKVTRTHRMRRTLQGFSNFFLVVPIVLGLLSFLVWLSPLVPYKSGSSVPGTQLKVFSTHPFWGFRGGEGEIRITMEKITTPVVIATLQFEPEGTIESPKGRLRRWTAEDEGRTQSIPVRFTKSGQIQYKVKVQGIQQPVAKGCILVLPIPGSLTSKILYPVVGAITAIITALINKAAELISKKVLGLLREGGNRDARTRS